jgi:hypothetical protein
MMNQSRCWFDRARQLCDEIGPEDGVDPRLLPTLHLSEKQSHKGKQLCKVAQRVLSLKMGEFSDPQLQLLSVLKVTSLHAGRSLLVVLSYEDSGLPEQELLIQQSLHAVEGSLRTAIAQSVKRKRIAALKFELQCVTGEEGRDAYS